MTRALLLLAVVMAGCDACAGTLVGCTVREVDGVPCVVCADRDSVAISCDWSRDGGGR